MENLVKKIKAVFDKSEMFETEELLTIDECDKIFNLLSSFEEQDENIDKFRKLMRTTSIPLKDIKMTEEEIDNLPPYLELLKYKKMWDELKKISEEKRMNNLMYDVAQDITELEMKEGLRKNV